MQVKFKSEQGEAYRADLEKQFNSDISPFLQFLLLNLASFVWRRFKKTVVVTCLNRTASANAALTGSNPNSAHLRGDAADLRSRDYSISEVEEMLRYVKHHWGSVAHIIHHTGTGIAPHIHININWPHSVKNFKE